MQQKCVPVDRGLYLVRYESAQDVFNPPQAKIIADSGSEQQVLIVSDPRSGISILLAPGTCLVVRANGPARLRIEIVPSCTNGSAAATIKMNRSPKARLKRFLPIR